MTIELQERIRRALFQRRIAKEDYELADLKYKILTEMVEPKDDCLPMEESL